MLKKVLYHGRLITVSLAVLMCVGCSSKSPIAPDSATSPSKPETISPPVAKLLGTALETKDETLSHTPNPLSDLAKEVAILYPADFSF